MNYFPNWFEESGIPAYFGRWLSVYRGKPNLRFLQIGAYTGDATIWLFEHILTSKTSTLDDVDPWVRDTDYIDVGVEDFVGVEQVYNERTQKLRQSKRLNKYKMTAEQFFTGKGSQRRPLAQNQLYDFIYVDGNHRAPYALEDMIDAWRHLKVGGIMAVDDYIWESVGNGPLYTPAIAIDAFLKIYAEQAELLELRRQAWIRKKADLWTAK